GESPVRLARGRRRGARVPVRRQRVRRSDHGDRAHAAHARRSPCCSTLARPPSPDRAMKRRLYALARVIGGLSLAACASSDIANPAAPALKVGYLCPASQSDVSVYKNLLFVSGEGMGGRLDCGTQGVHDSVSAERLRGLRIFDISDIANPKYIANVQTCRGSHTHSVVIDPNDTANVYVYISGAAPVRSPTELPGC